MIGLLEVSIVTLLIHSAMASPLKHEAEVATIIGRNKRSFRLRDNNLEVSVDVDKVNIHPGRSITVRCRAKGGVEVDDQPYVSFYRQLNDLTHLPVSSGDPGVQVEPSVPAEIDSDFFGYDSDDTEMRAVKVLTLSPESWETLTTGENLFYCRVSTLRGQTRNSFFVIRKPRPPRRRVFSMRRRLGRG